ncbi:MAG: SPFH domain-containing protein [Opitutales bacterium]|nr:SPFH domain-containing protein [Opitutales bacterium]
MKTPTEKSSENILGSLISCAPQSTELLVQKYDYDGIVRGGVIVVHETQRAALYINGAREKLLPPGRFTCDESANIPILNRLLSTPTGGETTYPVSVWFVSTTIENNLLWGIRILVFDTDYGQTINVALNGSAVVKISRPEIFLDKFVGTCANFTAIDVSEKIKSWLTTPIRTAAVAAFSQNGSLIRFQTAIAEMQARIRETLNSEVGSLYGLNFTRFEVRSIESDDYQSIVREERAGTAQARRLAKLGVNYATERQFGIMEKAAANEGAGTFMGAGMGLGAGLPLGATLGEMMKNTFAPASTPPSGTPPSFSTPPPIPPQTQAGAPTYFIALGGKPIGPFSAEQITDEIRRGTFSANTQIWKQGTPNWIPAGTDATFAPLFTRTDRP